MTTKINCKDCKFWKNNQRLLNYKEDSGVCLNPKFNFDVSDGRPISVIDTENRKDQNFVSGDPSHDFETKQENGFDINFSRYLLATNENFGCKLFEKK